MIAEKKSKYRFLAFIIKWLALSNLMQVKQMWLHISLICIYVIVSGNGAQQKMLAVTPPSNISKSKSHGIRPEVCYP